MITSLIPLGVKNAISQIAPGFGLLPAAEDEDRCSAQTRQREG